MTRSFPALGFDPAEGDRGAVATVLTSILRAGLQLKEVSTRMAEALDVSDDWSGDAAENFHDYGDDLPQAFGTGAESMQAVAEALSTWSGQLTANQARADELEAKAKKLKAQLKEAEAAMDEAASALPRDTGNPNYAERYDAYRRTVDTWSALNTALQMVIDDAERLKARHLREANAAASAVRSGPDDAFQPENDGWFVQVVDGVAKVSSIASAVTGVAAAALAMTVIGAPVAGALETASIATGGVALGAGVVQRVAKSKNAPSNLDMLLNMVPGRTVTSGAIGAVKGAARPAIGASRLRTGARGLREGVAEGFTSGGFPALGREFRDFYRKAAEVGVRNALKSKAATSGVILALTERNQLLGKAFAGYVDATTKTLEASGVKLSPGDRRELEAMKLAGNPTRAQVESGAVTTATNLIKGK
jgi:hypothetical protein